MNVVAIDKSAETVPSSEELVERARALVPMLRQRADEVERARSVPADIIQAFKDAGFFRILQPRRWGGWEMNPVVFMRVLSELGRAASAAGGQGQHEGHCWDETAHRTMVAAREGP